MNMQTPISSLIINPQSKQSSRTNVNQDNTLSSKFSIDRIHENKPTCTIHIEWVQGHKDIEGNEQADQAAKIAATSNITSPPIRMRSAQKRSIQSLTENMWKSEWRSGKETAKHLRAMSQHPETTTGLKLYGALQQRKHVVWLTRLRTGHCHVN